jgi:hypothetical protein
MDRSRAPRIQRSIEPSIQPLWNAWVLTSMLAVATLTPGCSQDEELDAASTRARFEQQGGDTSLVGSQSALLGTAANRTRTISAMMFDISTGPPVLATITNLISGPGRSQRHMYQEISYGLQDLTTDYQGPYTLPVADCMTIACCGPSSDRTGNGATVAAEIAALPKVYDHYFWIYGTRIPAGADCGTWGDEGRPNRPAVYSNYSFGSLVGYAQEIGHNFGMTHEPTMTCAGNATFLDDPTQCNHVEYGNALSFMGGGEHHPSAYHKFAQGWIGKCNVVKAGGSGTFTLVPQELPCDGVQLLQVAAPKVRAAPAAGTGGQARQGTAPMLSNYYLEMRAPYGFDSNLAPMVLVSIGAALPTAAAAAPYLYLLDLKPEAGQANLNNAGLMTVGQTYTDPAGGLTFTLMAIDARSATVNVTTTATGAATCSDATPFTLPGPDATSCGPLAGAGADGGVVPGTGGTTGTGAGGRAGAGGVTGGAGGVTGGGGAGGAPAGGAGGAAGRATGGASGAGGSEGGADSGTTGGNGAGAAAGGCSCDVSLSSSSSSSSSSRRHIDLAFSLLVAAGLVVRRRSRREGR